MPRLRTTPASARKAATSLRILANAIEDGSITRGWLTVQVHAKEESDDRDRHCMASFVDYESGRHFEYGELTDTPTVGV